MISAGEVGATFTIRDDASAVLQRLADQFNQLQVVIDNIKKSIESIGGADSGLGKLQETLTATGRSGEDAGRVITEAFSKVDGSVDSTVARVNALKTALTEAASAASGIRMPGGGGGGVRGPRVSEEEDEFNPRLNIPPHRLGAGFSVTGLGPWWAELPLAGAAYGLDEDLKVRQKVAEGVELAHVPADQVDAARESLYSRVANSAMKYHFSPEVTAEAYAKSETSLGTLSFEQRSNLEEALMPYAAGESRLKGTPLPESMRAMIGMVHMFQDYDPEDMKKIVPGFQMSSLFTPATLPQFERAASYPAILHTELGMDPNTILTQVAALQSAGVMNTKSGTWIKNFWQHMMASQGASKSDIEHNDALRELGLIDEGNKRTWGGTDPQNIDYNRGQFEVAKILSEKLDGMTPEQKTDLFHRAFGEQGKGWAGLEAAPKFVEQLTKMADMKATWEKSEGGLNVISSLSKDNPAEQLKGALSTFQTSMMVGMHDAAQPAADALKELAGAASQAGAAFKSITSFMTQGGNAINAINDAAQGNAKWVHDSVAGMFTDHPENATAPNLGKWLYDRAASWGAPAAKPSYDPLSSIHAGPVAAPPVTVSSPVTAPLSGTAQVSVTINNSSLASEIKQVVQAEIKGAFSGLMSMFKSGANNSAAGFDGRSAPQNPDGSAHGVGHN